MLNSILKFAKANKEANTFRENGGSNIGSVTVIYGLSPNKDQDTVVLQNLWFQLPNVRVYYTFRDDPVAIRRAAQEEKNILIMCGHGSPDGLFGHEPVHESVHGPIDGSPITAKKFGYTINGRMKFRAKYVIGVWCHAKDYAKKYHKTGFFTSMYISNKNEARFELGNAAVQDITNSEIWKSESQFCLLINSYIKYKLQDIEKWPEMVLKDLPPINVVEKFNHENLEYVYGNRLYDDIGSNPLQELDCRRAIEIANQAQGLNFEKAMDVPLRKLQSMLRKG